MTNKWDKRYGESGFAYGTSPNDFLQQNRHLLPAAGDVLCLAEGEGRNSVFLAEQGFSVTAVDSSEIGLQKAQQLAQDRGVAIQTKLSDLNDFIIVPESCDAIVSIFCHLPTVLRKKVHQATIHGLRQNGVFILEGYTPRQLDYGTGGPPTSELLMELSELKTELGELELIHAQETVREILEGRLHTGLGSVVQIVGVKK